MTETPIIEDLLLRYQLLAEARERSIANRPSTCSSVKTAGALMSRQQRSNTGEHCALPQRQVVPSR